MSGTLEILNVGAGDIKISFDHQNCSEAIRAKRIVTDMLRRGYALLVEVEPGKWARATGFDETKGEYLIADFDPVEAAEKDMQEAHLIGSELIRRDKDGPPSPPSPKKRGAYRKRGRAPMEKTKTTAVARSAGGPVENQR
jgi:hypothetical protein